MSKKKKGRRAVSEVLGRMDRIVTIRTITVCFKDRTVEVGGRKVTVSADCFSMPVLSGDAVFISRSDMERIC